MTFSPLISGSVPHHGKFSSRAGRPITRMIQHHWAGVGGGIERMSDPNQQASCTYIITTDGQILGHVPEEYRPWTSGSAEADAPSITIEVQNTGGQVNGNDSDPASWPISDAAYNAIIRLLVDVAQRHGWAAIDANTYVGHRQFYSTACPGGYLWSRMDRTRQLAQQVFTGSLSYAAESINVLEDDLPYTRQELKQIIEEVVQPKEDVTREYLKDRINDGVLAVLTGSQAQEDVTRQFLADRVRESSPAEIAALVPDAIAQQVIDLLADKLKGQVAG